MKGGSGLFSKVPLLNFTGLHLYSLSKNIIASKNPKQIG